MSIGRVAALLAAVVLSAPAAFAQEADPIGALLQQAQTPPPATPPAAISTPPAPIPATPPPAPYVPAYAPPRYTPPAPAPSPPRRQLTAPVHIDEIGKTPEGPPTATDLSYEARMRSSFNSAQGMQGPMDGAWTLRAAGAELYDLQLVDAGSGNIEGAWRDPRRRGAVDASGFIDSINRVGGRLTIRITPRRGAEALVMVLNAGNDGSWSGELTEHGERRLVTLRRN